MENLLDTITKTDSNEFFAEELRQLGIFVVGKDLESTLEKVMKVDYEFVCQRLDTIRGIMGFNRLAVYAEQIYNDRINKIASVIYDEVLQLHGNYDWFMRHDKPKNIDVDLKHVVNSIAESFIENQGNK